MMCNMGVLQSEGQGVGYGGETAETTTATKQKPDKTLYKQTKKQRSLRVGLGWLFLNSCVQNMIGYAVQDCTVAHERYRRRSSAAPFQLRTKCAKQ